MIVVDASVVVAALVLGGRDGAWAESVLEAGPLAAPHIMPLEVANILRRSALAGEMSEESATAAHRDLLALRVDLHGYEAIADRAWELRKNMTIYDASYVALAEALSAPFATLDRKLARAPGSRCEVRTPP